MFLTSSLLCLYRHRQSFCVVKSIIDSKRAQDLRRRVRWWFISFLLSLTVFFSFTGLHLRNFVDQLSQTWSLDGPTNMDSGWSDKRGSWLVWQEWIVDGTTSVLKGHHDYTLIKLINYISSEQNKKKPKKKLYTIDFPWTFVWYLCHFSYLLHSFLWY